MSNNHQPKVAQRKWITVAVFGILAVVFLLDVLAESPKTRMAAGTAFGTGVVAGLVLAYLARKMMHRPRDPKANSKLHLWIVLAVLGGIVLAKIIPDGPWGFGVGGVLVGAMVPLSLWSPYLK